MEKYSYDLCACFWEYNFPNTSIENAIWFKAKCVEWSRRVRTIVMGIRYRLISYSTYFWGHCDIIYPQTVNTSVFKTSLVQCKRLAYIGFCYGVVLIDFTHILRVTPLALGDRMIAPKDVKWYCKIGEPHYIDGLVQERRNSIAIALELRLSCTNPSIRIKKTCQ